MVIRMTMTANNNTDDFDIYRRHMVNNSSGSDDDKNNEIMKLHIYQGDRFDTIIFLGNKQKLI